MTPPRLVLASASPRRAALLARLGLTFEVDPSHIPEDVLEGEGPWEHAERLARAKAAEVLERHPDALVLAGDTVVVLGEALLGKPKDEEEAVAMLMSLSGRSHSVVSGLALGVPSGEIVTGSSTTRVTFRSFNESRAREYVATGEPMDKAGAYGIQGKGNVLVREVHGDYSTVVGLPLPLFTDLLERCGWRYDFQGLTAARPAATP